VEAGREIPLDNDRGKVRYLTFLSVSGISAQRQRMVTKDQREEGKRGREEKNGCGILSHCLYLKSTGRYSRYLVN